MWKYLGFDNILVVILREMRSYLKVFELKSVLVFNKVMLMFRLGRGQKQGDKMGGYLNYRSKDNGDVVQSGSNKYIKMVRELVFVCILKLELVGFID